MESFCFVFSVRELLKSGVSPDLVNEDGLTALHQVHTQTYMHTYLHLS